MVTSRLRRFGDRYLFDSLCQGVYKDTEAQDHLRALRQMQPNQDDAFVHDYLYDCLSILDTKVQGLLTFDSILIAAATVVLATISDAITIGSILIFIALVLSGVSSLLSLHVIRLYWTGTEDFANSHALFLELFAVRNRRTVAYRLSWMLAHAATITLIVGVFAQRRL